MAYFSIAIECVIEAGELDVPVVSDSFEGLPHFSCPKGAVSGDYKYVAEVPPSGACWTALQCSDYLLGEDHSHRVAAQLYRFLSEQPWQGDLGRLRPDWITDGDIDMEGLPCTCESRNQPDPHAAVLILFADCLRSHVV